MKFNLPPTLVGHDRYRWLLGLLGLALLASCVLSLGFGSARVPASVVWQILLHKVLGVGPDVPTWTAGQEHIVWLIRVPRMLLGALVGAGLALTGAVLQATTRNPLADPHLLGVTSGATLGAVIVVLHVGELIGVLTLPLAAFIGALCSMLMVLAIASRQGRLDSDRLLLCGIAVSFVMMALANLLLFMGDHRASSAVMFWMLGGLGLARWELLGIPAISVLIGLALLLAMARSLNALMAGEQTAVTLGLNARNVRVKVFLIASLMTGVMVSISGSIGFVGLMIPHIARRLVGAEHRRLLPVCVLMGSIFLVWVDVAARTLIAPEDLPIGVATAAIGGLFFIGLMRKGKAQ
ncbi:transport system permease [Paucimonas lemoignei]|nr:transport system permease [Paucimonas lemoignei]